MVGEVQIRKSTIFSTEETDSFENVSFVLQTSLVKLFSSVSKNEGLSSQHTL